MSQRCHVSARPDSCCCSPLLKLEQLNDQQRPLADEILKVASIGISGPFNLLLRSPVMGQRMFAMLNYLRFNSSVPGKLNEFAILIQARLWTSQVEWTAHYPIALKAGLPQAVADDLKVGKRPASMHRTKPPCTISAWT
jgi:4-carboxymuconolactone decarboxylase